MKTKCVALLFLTLIGLDCRAQVLSGLTSTNAALSTDILPIVANGGTYKISVTNLTSPLWTAMALKGTGTVTTLSFTGGIISIANPTTTPAFTVAGTSGGIPYFSAATTWASSATLAAGGIVVGGGAGTTPATVAAGATTEILVGGGASTAPVWTTASGTGAPARVGGPVFTGDPQVPNVVLTDSDTTAANTAFVKSNITAIAASDTAGTVHSTDLTVDNAIMRVDGTVGTNAQKSVVLIGDSGIITGVNTLTVTNTVTITAGGLIVGATNIIGELASKGTAGETSGTVHSAGTLVTDNALVRVNGAGGTNVQESVVIVSDAGAVTGVASITVTNAITGGTLTLTGTGTNTMSDLNVTNVLNAGGITVVTNISAGGTISGASVAITGTSGAGYLTFIGQSSQPTAPPAGTALFHARTVSGFTRLEIDNEGASNIVAGRDIILLATNSTGSNIAQGKAVYISGSTGSLPNVALARANSLTTLPAIGITLNQINNGAVGQVMLSGIAQFDTTGFSVGDQIYVSTSEAGAMQNTRPSGITAAYVQRVGTVITSASSGYMQVVVAPFIGNVESGTAAATWTGNAVVATSYVAGATNLIGEVGIKAPLASPAFTSNPTAPNVVLTDSDTTIPNTAFVKSNITAFAASPAFTGDPTVPNVVLTDSDTTIANTAFVKSNITASVTYATVTNALGLTGSTLTFLRSDGSQATPAGAGNVVGPLASTDNAIARYDLTTGTIIQDSVVIVGDSGIITGVNSLTSTNAVTASDFIAGATNFVAALALKAPLASPALTGDPTVPNIVLTDSDTTVANTAFVKSNITAITVFKNISIPADSFMINRTNAATAVTNVYQGTGFFDTPVYSFTDLATNRITRIFNMPENWNASTVKFKFNWSCTNTTGNVVWWVHGKILPDNGDPNTAWGTSVSVTDTAQTASRPLLTGATGAMTFGGTPAAGGLAVIEVYRDPSDGSDTLAGLAELWTVNLGYTETITAAAW